MNIFYTTKFERAFKKLPPFIKKLSVAREIIFRNDIWDIRLRTHKLSGNLNKYYSFSVDYSYRILFEITENGDVIFLNIGDHDIYK